MRVRGIACEMDLTALILIGLFTFPLATSTFPASFRSWSGAQIWFAAIAIGLLIFGCYRYGPMRLEQLGAPPPRPAESP